MRPRWAGRWGRREPCGAGGADLARPWRQLEYCVIDVETTGLDLRRDAIVSYGAVIVRDGRILGNSSRYSLVRPDCEISGSSMVVHALREADLAEAPSMSECVDDLVDLLSGRILVAHAAWIEQAFLGRALRRCGRRLAGPVVDTAALARAVYPTAFSRDREPSLEGLSMRLGLPVHAPHHALGDALTTAQLLLVLPTRLRGGKPTAQDLIALTEQYSIW